MVVLPSSFLEYSHGIQMARFDRRHWKLDRDIHRDAVKVTITGGNGHFASVGFEKLMKNLHPPSAIVESLREFPKRPIIDPSGDLPGGQVMAIFEKMNSAVSNRDADAYLALYDEDAVFVRHQSGAEMSKAQFGEMIRKMMASDDMNMGDRRCIYENDDILVVHSINDYPDGTREAVLMACTKKNGKISRVETGATPLQK